MQLFALYLHTSTLLTRLLLLLVPKTDAKEVQIQEDRKEDLYSRCAGKRYECPITASD
jgi:hypothetical protein